MLEIVMLDLPEDEALQLMKESDIYSFLLFPDIVDGETEPRSAQSEGGVQLAFRHIGILNAIYDSLSFEERIGMNKFVAEVFEGLLSQENQDALLPSVEFHYSRAGEIEKIIQYREILG
ncbi:hypothetical protein HK101_000858 [Irineochytrium annulatum]|nr:hypothetical protein HK101_000858 [Irineochytrium annulatum]